MEQESERSLGEQERRTGGRGRGVRVGPYFNACSRLVRLKAERASEPRDPSDMVITDP